MGSQIQSFCMSSMILLLVVVSATPAIFQPTSAISLEQNNTSTNISQVFEDWITRHHRVYSSSEEKARRFENFKAKYRWIQKFNSEGGKKYTVGLNDFSDMTTEEFQSKYRCKRTPNAVARARTKMFDLNTWTYTRECGEAPVDWTVDTWRVGGGTKPSPASPVRNQGDVCGACWAIATVAAVEAANRITWGPDIPLPPLSIQQILDCAPGGRCEGGSELDAYAYIMKNKGLASEQRYGYTEMNGTCDESRARQVAGGSIMGFTTVNPPTDEELKKVVCKLPVTASIAAGGPASGPFDNYEGGMYHGPCGQKVDHTVLVVGFGRDDDGTEFWKIQNSYGESWGEKGYMRMSLETGEQCKITMDATFPLVNYTRSG